MLLHTGLVIAFGVSAISAVTITASDLPECAVECYCYTGEKVKIAVTDYEKQCRSAPFQLALRECAVEKCNEEEFAFTEYQAKEYCAEFGVDLDTVLKEYGTQGDAQNEEKEEVNDFGLGNLDGSVDGIPVDDTGDITAALTPVATSTCTRCTPQTATGLLADNTVTPTASTVSSTGSAATSPSGSVSMASHRLSNSWVALTLAMVAVLACSL